MYDDFYLGAPATTWLYGAHNGDLSKGTLETQVISAEGWHGNEVLGSEEGKRRTTDMRCERSENPAQ